MHYYILLILFFLSLSLKAQNYLDSLRNSNLVCYLDSSKLAALGVNEIKIYTFLDEDEKRKLPTNKDIRSKVTHFKYSTPGKVKEIIRNYTGLDSTGTNPLASTGETDEILINGIIYYYNPDGKIGSTLSYGAGVNPNSGYIYDHEGQLVMIRYYYNRVMSKFSESAGRTIFDYYPQNGKIKYKIKLDNNGSVENAEYFIYDNVWNLLGIANMPGGTEIKPYKPYLEIGKVAPWQFTINGIPATNYLLNKKQGCNTVLIEAAPWQYYLIKF